MDNPFDAVPMPSGSSDAQALGKIFPDWDASLTERYGREPLCINHSLHTSPLFSRDALAALIEVYPREHYSLIHMGAQNPTAEDVAKGASAAKRFWREGEIGDLRGEDVLRAIEAGRLWINLRNIQKVDARYRDLVEAIFAELAERVPGRSTFDHIGGILISSPRAQVYYHYDLSGQSLFQISGRKRVYIYPSEPPFLTPEHLEHVAVNGVEVDTPYDPAYDAHANVYDLEPGQMLHWPLNGPHRVENADCLNVSLTTEFWTEDIRRKHMMNVANGILRYKLSMKPGGRPVSGPAFWGKAALQAVARRSGWLQKEQAALRPIEFRLDGNRLGEVIDLNDSRYAAQRAAAE